MLMSQRPTSPSMVPPAPREPTERARRLIFRHQGAAIVLRIVGGAFLGVGAILASVFCGGLVVDAMIALGPRAVTGRVVERGLDYSTRVNGRHPTKLRFAYEVDGASHEGTSSTFDRAIIARSAVGAPVALEVAASRPSLARVAGTMWSPFGWFGLFTLIFPGVGGALFFSTVFGRRRRVRAYVAGRATTARVVSAGPDRSVRINGRSPYRIAWELQGPDGRTYRGAISSMDRALVEDLLTARELVVVHDPDDPSVNTVYV